MRSTPRILWRNRCRICGNAAGLYNFLTLPRMPLPSDHLPPGTDERSFCEDLPLYWCEACGAVQTQHDLDLSDYYLEYSYTVSHSETVQRFMRSFAEEAWRRFGFQPGDSVVEVGSGDGGQLKHFKDRGARVLGFEPAEKLSSDAEKQGVPTVQGLFDRTAALRIPGEMLPLRAVIVQYTLDHLPEPVVFLQEVSRLLDQNEGIVIIEVHDFEKIYDRLEACLFTHEHATYLTVHSFQSLFAHAGLRLVCADFLPEALRRGNSLIVVGTNAKSRVLSQPVPASPILDQLKRREAYTLFAARVISAHASLARHIRGLRAGGRRVAGYGAAARGSNTIAIAGLTREDLSCVFDLNPALHGRLMPGSDIPVASPLELLEHPNAFDDIIVFNYGYLDEIQRMLAPFSATGGTITSMLPYLRPDKNSPE